MTAREAGGQRSIPLEQDSAENEAGGSDALV
jgi:hypothetical protein